MKLARKDLYSLETYAEIRADLRARVMAHKKRRRVALGPHATLYFEDRLTMQYQIQEMLRAERIFEAGAIQDELDAYNPLIPDGSNWKATFMIEIADPHERQSALARLRGIEDRIWARAQGCEAIRAIADEDLTRENDAKTSAVHFLRFELPPAMAAAMKSGADLTLECDHPHYRQCVAVDRAVRDALVADLIETPRQPGEP